MCFTLRYHQPEHIIESGIYKGLGTWMLRQAAPQAQLILIDPAGGKLAYRYGKPILNPRA